MQRIEEPQIEKQFGNDSTNQDDRYEDIKSKLQRYKREREELDKIRQQFSQSGKQSANRAKSMEGSRAIDV
jgi:hypothetical protein